MLLLGLRGPLPQIGGWFKSEAPYRMIYVIWFMCVWTTIVVSTNMVVHDKSFNDQPPKLKLFAL